MDGGKIYKYVEFAILIVGIVLFVKYSGLTLEGETAIAFEWEKQVNVYFSNTSRGSNENCELVFPVKRKIPNAEMMGPGAIDALLKGPTGMEKMEDYITSINSGVLLQKFEVKNGVAYVDFNSRFSDTAGSCRVTAIRAQITNTLTSLPNIKSVVISVNDKTEGILEP